MALQAVIKLTRAQYEILRNGGTVGDYTGIDNTKYLYFIQEETDYLPYAYWSSDHGVDNLPFGVTSSQIKQTGQYGENHSVFMYFNQVGTPFQLQIPDSSESYIYKRYYSGGSWSAWSKVNAGYADSAGDASTLQGYSPSSFLIKSVGGTLTAPLQTTSTFALTNNEAPEQSVTFTKSVRDTSSGVLGSNLIIRLKEPTGSAVGTRTTTYTLANDNDGGSYHFATKEWVESRGYVTSAVTPSGTLTSNDIILGDGGSTVKASGKRIADHNTTWDVISDSSVPTMWAISSYVSGLNYVSYSSQSLTDAQKEQARTNINAADGTKVRFFEFHAGGQYVGWVSVAKLQLDSNNYFDYQAFDVFICRNYNSPASESYSCNITIGWCSASIRLVSKNVGQQIIKQLRLALDETNHRLYLQVYVDTNYSTYSNGCEMDLVGLLKSGWLAEDSVMDNGLTAVAVLNLTLGTEADTAGNADTVDNKHASDFVNYHGNQTVIGGNSPASGAKDYWTNKIPSNSLVGLYNTSGAEYSMLFAKNPGGGLGSILRWGYPDNYLWILRKSGDWVTSDWEKISAGYADSAGNADTLDGHDSAYFATASSLSGYVPFDATTARATVDGTNASPHFYNLENNTLINGYGDYWYVINLGHYSGNNYASQIAMNYQDSISDTDMFIRTAYNSTWRSWRRVLTDNNYSSYALSLSGGTVTGDVTVTGNSNDVTFTIGGNYSKGTLRIWDGADGDYIDLKADAKFNRQTLFIPNEGDEHTIATREWVTESYWADVNISASSNKGTTPTFSTVTIGGSGNTAGKATMQYNANEDCIDFVFA